MNEEFLHPTAVVRGFGVDLLVTISSVSAVAAALTAKKSPRPLTQSL